LQGGLALLGVVAGVGFGFKTSCSRRAPTGSIVITAAGSNEAALTNLRVLVDGSERCSLRLAASRCRQGLTSVRAEAPGFVGTADRAVTVEKNGEATPHGADASGRPKPRRQ
jgi:hypothetical protein